MNREQKLRVVLLVGLVACGATVAYGLTNPQIYTAGSTVETDSGLAVTVDDDTDLPSGNPFPDSDSVVIRNIEFSASGDSALELESNTTEWTNVSNIDASSTQVEMVPVSKPTTRFSGGIDAVSLSNDVSVQDNGRVEAVVEAPSSGTITVDTNGEGAVAVDADTGSAIDEGSVNPDGTVTFDLPAGTHRIDFQSAPSTLFVFQEQNPDELITGSAELRVRFFVDGSEEVIERTVSDGTVNLSTLPSDQRFVVSVAAEGTPYTYRRIVVESLSQQQDVYLLNQSRADTVDVTFNLIDYTGQFPSADTTLLIDRPITKDFDNDNENETRYRTILGDNFGSTGQFPATLARNERYRLRIMSGSNQRVLGAYTAAQSETEPIRIQDLTIESEEIGVWTTLASESTSNGQRELTIRYIDQNTETTRVEVEVYPRGNESQPVYQDTVTNAPIQNYSVYMIPIENDTSYVINWTITRDGETFSETTLIGGGGINIDVPLDSDWLGTFGFVFVCFIASLAGARKDHIIGVAVVAVAGLMMGLKFVNIAVPLWWAAALIAVGGYLAQEQEAQ